MLKQLRASTKWIMIIVVIFFVGMIVLQWGMDIGGSRRGVSAGIVGSVNGQDVQYEYYDRLFRQQQEMASQNQQLTVDQIRKLHEDTWNYIVPDLLIDQEIEKRGITVTDAELLGYMMNNPVSIAYQAPMFMENDTFSLSKYQEFLQNPSNFSDPQARQILNYIEQEARNVLPRVKLQKSLEDAVVISDSQVRNRWLRDNEQRNIQWFFVSTSSINQYPADVSFDEARAYYEEHKEDYRHEEMRGLDVVFFSLKPTTADSLEAFDRATLLVDRARGGEDFSTLADDYSDDPGNISRDGTRQGGDLGFFSRGTMAKEFEDVAFSLKPEEMSDTFLSPFGYHVVKVDSIKYKEDSKEIEQVKARHILLKIQPSGETRDRVETSVRSFYEDATGGLDFSLRAQVDSLIIQQTPLFTSETQYIPNIGTNTQLLTKRTFRAKKGAVLPVYATENGYFVVRVSEVVEAGIPPFEDVQDRVVEDAKREMRIKYLEKFCASVEERMRVGIDLTEAVNSVRDSLVVATPKTELVRRNYYVPGLGTMNTLVARTFGLSEAGACTGVVTTQQGCGMVQLVAMEPIDEQRYENEKVSLKERMKNEIQQSLMTRYIENLRENADIVDNRDMVLNW